MERLTKLGRVMGEEKVCCTHFDCKECNDLSGQCSDGCSWEEQAWEKLFDYEETGLEPEEIRNLVTACAAFCKNYDNGMRGRLEQLAAAEKEGRLFTPPVKVGDKVYSGTYDEVTKEYVIGEPEEIVEVGTRGFFLAWDSDPDYPVEFHPYEELGKGFFLTFEDALHAKERLEEKKR